MKDTFFNSVKYLSLFLLSVLMISCGGKKRGHSSLLPEGTGAPWDLLVVMNKSEWSNTEGGRALFEVLNDNIYGLPQPEPIFKISRVDSSGFKGIFLPVKNIIQTEISPSLYTKAGYKYFKNVYSNSQYILKITAPDNKSFAGFVRSHRDFIQNFFINAEYKRTNEYLKKKHNRKFSKEIREQFGIDMYVPAEMTLSNQSGSFFWASNGKSSNRMDLVVYAYPYVDKNTFTQEYLDAKRDSVLKYKIPGGPKGSYMGTQDIVKPDFKELTINGEYAVEIRGLWEVKGDVMGGPFVSVTRLDKERHLVITTEVFVYAPEKKKRNLLRYAEASLFSVKFVKEDEKED